MMDAWSVPTQNRLLRHTDKDRIQGRISQVILRRLPQPLQVSEPRNPRRQGVEHPHALQKIPVSISGHFRRFVVFSWGGTPQH